MTGDGLPDAIDVHLADVETAWRLAAARTDAALAAGEPAPSILDEVRYGLTVSGLRSMTDNIPPDLVERLVAAGMWEPRRGIAHADRMSPPERRAFLLNRLLPHVEPAERPAVADRIIAGLADTVGSRRAEQYIAMAAHLTPDRLGPVIAAARTVDPVDYRAAALAGLAPHLPVPQRTEVVDEAFVAAMSTGHPALQADALGAVVPHLNSAQLASARAAAYAIDDGRFRVRALARVAAHLPEPDSTVVRRYALAVAEGLDNARAKAGALVDLAPHTLDRAFAASVAAADGSALSRLVPHLREDQIEAALTAALSLGEHDRHAVLGKLASRLSPEQLDRAIAAADASHGSQSDLYCLLAPNLSPHRVVELLCVVDAWPDDHPRRDARIGLAPHAPDPVRRDTLLRVLASATAIHSRILRAHAVAALAPHLPEERRSAAARQIWFGTADAGRQPHEAAAVIAAALAEPGDWADALLGLLPHLEPAQRDAVVHEAVRSGHRVTPDEPLDEDGAAVVRPPFVVVRDERAEALATSFRHLPREQQQAEIAAAVAGQSPRVVASMLTALVMYLSVDQQRQAIAAVAAIRQPELKAKLFVKLARHLPDRLLGEAVAAAGQNSNRFWHNELLAHLAHRLTPELLAGVMRDVDQHVVPVRAFARRAQTLVDADPTPQRIRLAIDVLRLALPQQRGFVALAAVAALTDTIVAVGGPGTALGVLDAIDDVAQDVRRRREAV